jgi:hypothetical protein
LREVAVQIADGTLRGDADRRRRRAPLATDGAMRLAEPEAMLDRRETSHSDPT